MLFFLINLAYASDSARIIIQKDDTKNEDFVVNLYNGDYLDNQSILDYTTKKNKIGYLIKDNLDMIIHIANRNITSNACSIEYFYYDKLNNRNIKVRTKDSYYLFDSVTSIIPEHCYTYLKSLNRLNGKTFVVKINYEKRVNLNYTNASTSIIDNNDKNEQDTSDYKLEHYNKSFYFKLLPEDEYLAYKKIKDEADSFTIVKDGPVSIKKH